MRFYYLVWYLEFSYEQVVRERSKTSQAPPCSTRAAGGNT